MEDETLATGIPNLAPPLRNTATPRDREPDDLTKLRVWQEKRVERKLRGEYESAILRLSELIHDNHETPMKVSCVRVEGAKNTRKSFLAFLINPILSQHNSTDGNLEGVLRTVKHISHVLQETDVFKFLDAKIERSRDALADPNDVDIVIRAREKGRLYLNSSTELGNNEGNASATARVRNAFGGAELFEANLSFGTKTKRSFRAALSAPVTSNLKTAGELSVYGLERDNTSFASSMEGLRGFKALVRTGAVHCGMHELAYEAVLRYIKDLTPTASISMREAAGQSLKTSISHTFTLDTRNDKISATKGYYLKAFHEFAGLGGDASFYKVDLESQISRPLGHGVSISFAARSGLLWGLHKETLFSDRFQLGGPTSIRAFRANGLGPHDEADAIGGDIHWSAGVSLISNIPKRDHWPIKLHGWLNAGRLDAVDKNKPLVSTVQETLTKPSISAGVGLLYRFDPIRMEVNFGVPLIASKSDSLRRGIQVGIGLEFL